MSEFKAIETQEELNKIIGERINKAKESALAEASEKYADYEELKTQNQTYAEQVKSYTEQLEAFKGQSDAVAEKDARIKELEAQNAKYETDSVKTRIALELNIPLAMADRLSGTTEDEIREDATKMAGYFTQSRPSAPSSNPEAETIDPVTAAFMKLNPNIKL